MGKWLKPFSQIVNLVSKGEQLKRDFIVLNFLHKEKLFSGRFCNRWRTSKQLR